MGVRKRYNKVKILAEEGATEGERQAALEAMKRMEENHPELRPKMDWRHVPFVGPNLEWQTTQNTPWAIKYGFVVYENSNKSIYVDIGNII